MPRLLKSDETKATLLSTTVSWKIQHSFIENNEFKIDGLGYYDNGEEILGTDEDG